MEMMLEITQGDIDAAVAGIRHDVDDVSCCCVLFHSMRRQGLDVSKVLHRYVTNSEAEAMFDLPPEAVEITKLFKSEWHTLNPQSFVITVPDDFPRINQTPN